MHNHPTEQPQQSGAPGHGLGWGDCAHTSGGLTG